MNNNTRKIDETSDADLLLTNKVRDDNWITAFALLLFPYILLISIIASKDLYTMLYKFFKFKRLLQDALVYLPKYRNIKQI